MYDRYQDTSSSSRLEQSASAEPYKKRNRSHTQTHDTNDTTHDHAKHHRPHFRSKVARRRCVPPRVNSSEFRLTVSSG